MGKTVLRETVDRRVLQHYAERRYAQGLLSLVKTYHELMSWWAAGMIQGRGGWSDLVQYREDIVHDALIRIDDSLRKCDDPIGKACRLSGWVKRNVRWTVSDYRRALLACRRRQGSPEGPFSIRCAAEPDLAEDIASMDRGESMEEAQRRSTLHDMRIDYQRVAAELKDRERRVLGMRIHGYTFNEIGRELRLKPPAVATLHYRALEGLKASLE